MCYTCSLIITYTLCPNLQHKSQRLLQVLLERLHPFGRDGTIHSPVITAQSSLHHLNLLETLGVLWCQFQLVCRSSQCQDTRLRRVDDGGKVVDTVHSQVGNGECSTLVLFRFQLAISSFGSESFGLSGNGGQTLGSDVFDDGGDETVGSSDGNADVGLFVSTRELQTMTLEEAITHCRIVSPNQAELASGTSANAKADALTTDDQLVLL